MVDVARAAGVAHVTVSRVLNEPDNVRPQTREKVLAAIDALGYRRNDVARALKSGRSTTIGVVIAGSELFELPRVLRGVEEAAQAAGFWVNLASWQGGSTEQLTSAVERLADQGVAGVAIIADRPVAATALEQMVSRIPVSVVMSGDIRNPAIGSVELDQELGARRATEHLLRFGHRRIAHITGRMSVYDARARLAGWQTAMIDAGLEAADHVEGDFTAGSGFLRARELLARGDRPTAIFAGNDQMAIGVYSAAAGLGLSVPHDVSVVGFDDMAGADFLTPALTTVRQDFVALGRTAIEVLLAEVAGDPARHHLIPTSLVERASVAAPPP